MTRKEQFIAFRIVVQYFKVILSYLMTRDDGQLRDDSFEMLRLEEKFFESE